MPQNPNLVLKAWGILGELPFFSKYCQAMKLVSDVSAGQQWQQKPQCSCLISKQQTTRQKANPFPLTSLHTGQSWKVPSTLEEGVSLQVTLTRNEFPYKYAHRHDSQLILEPTELITIRLPCGVLAVDGPLFPCLPFSRFCLRQICVALASRLSFLNVQVIDQSPRPQYSLLPSFFFSFSLIFFSPTDTRFLILALGIWGIVLHNVGCLETNLSTYQIPTLLQVVIARSISRY